MRSSQVFATLRNVEAPTGGKDHAEKDQSNPKTCVAERCVAQSESVANVPQAA